MQDYSRIVQNIDKVGSAETPKVSFSSIIPKSFWLGGLKIDVHFDESLVVEKNVIGQASYTAQEILIDPSVAPLQFVEQSYLHELVHWIFYMMSEQELCNNERLVDLFAHFLYQALSTAEGTSDVDVPLDELDAKDRREPESSCCFPQHYNEPDYENDPYLAEEDSHLIRIPWCENPDIDSGVIEHEGGENTESSFDEFVCTAPWNDHDYDPNADERELAQQEWEEEEESRHCEQTENESWAEVSDCWARSDDEGWYYDDDD